MSLNTLVDSHCHLDFPDFQDDLPDVVNRAIDAGVRHMLTICTHVTKFDQVLKVAEGFDNIWCTVGIHPHNAGTEPETSAETLIKMAENPKVIGFGETGLDYFYEHSPRDAQKKSFIAHIEAARSTGLPVIVHSRDADDDTIEILQSEYEKGSFTGLIHCFSGGDKLAKGALDIGFYISLSGILTFKKAEDLRETAKKVPLNRLLVETDSPYLAPVPKRGKRNEPAFTAHTAACLAETLGVSTEEITRQTTENFYNLFTKSKA